MKKIKSKTFDEKFDNNEDISQFIDWENAKRGDDSPMRVSVDFPRWMISSLDKDCLLIYSCCELLSLVVGIIVVVIVLLLV